MRLTDVVTTAVNDTTSPAGVLAITYAESIDEATHVPLGLAAALDLLRRAAEIADESGTASQVGDENMRAFRKVAAALSAVSVASDLGPKLLAALDALLLTPKAQAAIGARLPAPTGGGPLQGLKDRHDGRHLRPVG